MWGILTYRVVSRAMEGYTGQTKVHTHLKRSVQITTPGLRILTRLHVYV